jgi:acetyltransferase
MSDLDKLFKPQSIAVVGASNNHDKVGCHLLYALRKYPGKLYPINRGGGKIQGRKAYPSLQDVGEPIDLAALCIPARACLGAIEDAAKAGVGVIFITGGGFAEADQQGQSLQDEIVDACRRNNIRLLGPNTAGFFNPKLGVMANFAPLVSFFPAGDVAVVSQSGSMSIILGTVLQTNRLGVSIGVGVGNSPDISASEILEYLADHEETKAIAVYLEGVEDGRRLFDAISKTTRKKPVVVFTVGRSDIGDFASSHTGALMGSFALKIAALRQAGAVVVSSSNDLIDAVHILSKIRLAPNNNPGVGMLSGQAGPALVMTDYLRSNSVSVPELQQDTVEEISKVLSVKTYIQNPVDTARPLHYIFESVFSSIIQDENIELLLTYALHEPMCVEPVKLFQAMQRKHSKPMVFVTGGVPEDINPTLRDLESMDVPAFCSPERGALAVWALVEDARARYRKEREADTENRVITAEPFSKTPDEAEAKKILLELGIPVPLHRVCRSHEDALHAFKELQKPCVAKVLSRSIGHKTEVGGVHLHIEGEDALETALKKIDSIEGVEEKKYLLEEEAAAGLEIIIGAKNDDSFGPTVLLGMGGTAAEAMEDISIRLAPLTVHDGLDMIAELKVSTLFDGWRGGPHYDKTAVAKALVTIGSFIAGHPEIKEIDLNPVRVYESGLVVLDALVV